MPTSTLDSTSDGHAHGAAPRALDASQLPLTRFRYFDLLLSAFVAVLLISNLVGQKICAVGPFRISGAQLLFPITYIFGDVFTEVYGYAASRRAIWSGFFASGLLSLMGLVTVALPPAPDWKGQEAFATVFDFVPRLVVASLAAYWAGEFTNSFVLAKMKVLTGGRHLWTRTIGSTVAGQAVDTVVVMVLAFGGRESIDTIVRLIYSGYLGKVLYETLATPLTYLVVNFLKRREGVDVFDRGTNFSPFHMKV
jgi:queuosine precursor transporter